MNYELSCLVFSKDKQRGVCDGKTRESFTDIEKFNFTSGFHGSGWCLSGWLFSRSEQLKYNRVSL
jgi:hypothetical protein